MKSPIVLCLALVALVFVSYCNVLHGPFLWDDESLVVSNSLIQDWKNIPTFFSFSAWPTEDARSFYRPLQMITYVCDYQLWGLNPFGYHLTNIVIHTVVVLALFLLLFLIIKSRRAAWFGSFVFAVHPVHTEAVSYVSGRADLLAAFFVIALFIAYTYLLHTKGRRQWFILPVVMFFFLCALGSKEVSVFSVLLLPFWHRVCGKKKGSAGVVTFVSLLGILVLYWGLRFGNAHSMSGYDVYGFSFFERCLLAVRVFAKYCVLLVAPVSLHMEYIVLPPETVLNLGFFTSAVFCLLFAGALIWTWTSCKELALGLTWFLVLLFPVLNLVPINATFAEHWLYIPMLGLSISMAAFQKCFVGKRYGRLFGVVCCLIVCLFMGRTIIRNNDWTDPVSFYQGILAYNANDVKVHYNLGNEYLRRDDAEKAVQHYQHVIRIISEKVLVTDGQGSDTLLRRLLTKTYNNLGNAERVRGNTSRALEAYQHSLTITPQHSVTHENIMRLYEVLGDETSANKHRQYIEYLETIETRG